MKKFRFTLETVLSYKQQILDSLRTEHGVILARVRQQEEWLERLWQNYRDFAAEYRARCAEGIEVKDALACQAGLRAREREIRQETQRLDALRKQEEEKRMEVVAAKQDASSIEKLKEKKLDAYNASVAKSEEQLIEEFVSSRRSTAAQPDAI